LRAYGETAELALNQSLTQKRRINFGMYTGSKFSTAVATSNGANYGLRGSGIGTSTWFEPGDWQPWAS